MSSQSVALVTGAAGFIGSHVTTELLNRGLEVVALDDLSGGALENVDRRAVFAEGSILDNDLLDSLFKRYRFGRVFHLAAYAAECLSHYIKRFNYINNLIGSINLINCAIRHESERFIFTSSFAVYGGLSAPMQEGDKPDPTDSYGIAKAAVESELQVTESVFGLPFVILRPHNVYGERQNIADKYRNVVGIFMNQLLQGQPMSIYGDGSQRRAFTYIGDISPLIVDAGFHAAAKNQTINLGTSNYCSVDELASLVASSLQVPRNVRYFPERHEVKDVWGDHSLQEQVFGKACNTGLADGLEIMANWVRSTGPKTTATASPAIEIYKSLPSNWK